MLNQILAGQAHPRRTQTCIQVRTHSIWRKYSLQHNFFDGDNVDVVIGGGGGGVVVSSSPL